MPTSSRTEKVAGAGAAAQRSGDEPTLTPIRNRSLADQARDMIRQAIFDGRILPDERLTIERIAQDFGISRTPVREALKALESDGIVRILPHRGAVVQKLDREEVADRYSVRAVLEGYAGELACRAAAARVAPLLDENNARLARRIAEVDGHSLEEVRGLVEINEAFHRLILDASDSPATVRLLESLAMPLAYKLYHWRVPARRQSFLEFHRKIAAAFAGNRPKEVRRLLEQHTLEARDYLLSDH